MGGGRKNLKRAIGENALTLQQGQSIMQVLSLRGSNIIEVMDAKGEKSLAIFPAKFQKSLWIKRGSFVVVDESGRVEAVESGSKVACVVSQVLFHEQVRRLQNSPEWPETFKSQVINESKIDLPEPPLEQEVEETGTSDDDGLPPLESNMNRMRPFDLHADSGSGSDSDIDTDTDS